MSRLLCPPEEAEQRTVAAYLDARGDLLWFHPPNESLRSPRQGRRLQLAGMKRGVQDFLIFTGTQDGLVGTAIELKRRRGGMVTPEQKQWRLALAAQGWCAEVCRGADEAIALIERHYGKPGRR